MIVLKGKGVSAGIVFGKLRYCVKAQKEVAQHRVDDENAEIRRYQKANEEAVRQLGALYEKALVEVGEQGAALFEIHRMMLCDEDYCEFVRNIIATQKVNAEYAVSVTAKNFSEIFSQMDDAYMKERASDIHDVSERLLAVLSGREPERVCFEGPVILAARDFSPGETVQMDKERILAFVTEHGGANSHAAILARSMNIPSVIRVPKLMSGGYDGCDVIVNGSEGIVYVNPDEETCSSMREKMENEQRRRTLREQLKGKPNITRDGREILVHANIGKLSDLGAVLQNDAGGVGLFRTEFLYLERSDYPTEEEQFRVYRQVAEMMAGKRVIFRTLDIGADKQADYFNFGHEKNPALGMRAIRICITRPDIFKTQLRALYRASAFGKVAVMFPMIASVWEIRRAKEMAEEVKRELSEAGLPFSPVVETGIMIETPAAAVISDILAEEADFFSIGTNDLIQYVLACDRQSQNLDRFCDPHHTAIMRLIEQTVVSAHKAGIWVGICGELAADISLTEWFLRIGVDELSVSPSAVLPLREKIVNTGGL
jgi:phosphotransferase system enzyme I (PtsI)